MPEVCQAGMSQAHLHLCSTALLVAEGGEQLVRLRQVPDPLVKPNRLRFGSLTTHVIQNARRCAVEYSMSIRALEGECADSDGFRYPWASLPSDAADCKA